MPASHKNIYCNRVASCHVMGYWSALPSSKTEIPHAYNFSVTLLLFWNFLFSRPTVLKNFFKLLQLEIKKNYMIPISPRIFKRLKIIWLEICINLSINVNSSLARAITRVPGEQIFLHQTWSKILNVSTNKAKADWLTFLKRWHMKLKTRT